MTSALRRAFPEALGGDVALVAATMPPAFHTSMGDFAALVRGEPLTIPYRIYHPEANEQPTTVQQATIAHCIYTRHSDGFVRQRHLNHLFGANQLWVAPFVLHLVGEYVIEILQDIEQSLHLLDRDIYGAFLSENPRWLPLLERRCISYWDCYYRSTISRADYPGLRVTSVLREWQLRSSS